MKERWLTNKQRRWLIAGMYFLVILSGFFYYILVTATSFENPCQYFEETGRLCGGCGATRMMLSLLEFNIPLAFSYNPVMFIVLCIWNVIAVGAFVGRPRFWTNPWFLSTMALLTILVVAGYTFVRT